MIKPANETPYCALAIAKLAEKAGIPAGVINVVTGKSQEIGSVFTSKSEEIDVYWLNSSRTPTDAAVFKHH